MEFQHLLWAPLVVTAPVDLLPRISSVEGGSTLRSLEMVIPIMLMSLRMILNTLDPRDPLSGQSQLGQQEKRTMDWVEKRPGESPDCRCGHTWRWSLIFRGNCFRVFSHLETGGRLLKPQVSIWYNGHLTYREK